MAAVAVRVAVVEGAGVLLQQGAAGVAVAFRAPPWPRAAADAHVHLSLSRPLCRRRLPRTAAPHRRSVCARPACGAARCARRTLRLSRTTCA